MNFWPFWYIYKSTPTLPFSYLSFGSSQSATRLHGNTPLWLAAATDKARLWSRSISRYLWKGYLTGGEYNKLSYEWARNDSCSNHPTQNTQLSWTYFQRIYFFLVLRFWEIERFLTPYSTIKSLLINMREQSARSKSRQYGAQAKDCDNEQVNLKVIPQTPLKAFPFILCSQNDSIKIASHSMIRSIII